MADREYPKLEVEAGGQSVLCQILNWDGGSPPRFLVCNPLKDDRFREPSVASYRMGAWMKADLREVVEDAARLDFLDSLNAALNKRCGTTYRWKMTMTHNVNRLSLDFPSVDINDVEARGLPSCRDAIDAEMRRIFAVSSMRCCFGVGKRQSAGRRPAMFGTQSRLLECHGQKALANRILRTSSADSGTKRERRRTVSTVENLLRRRPQV